MTAVEAVLALVVLAIAIAAVAERLRTPAPSVLVLAGLAVGFIPGVPTPAISPHLVTLGVLPPLLFAAAQQLSLPHLRRVWAPVALLAVGLVGVSAIAIALVTHTVDPAVALGPAFVLGAILASTDPVAVSALSRRLRLPEWLVTTVQAESLFNDATSLVLFQVAVLSVVSGGLGVGNAALRFVTLGGGGAAVGLVVGLAGAWLLRRTHEPTVQTAIALVTPYVAAVGADPAHVSGVMAVIASGLVFAGGRRGLVEAPGRLMSSSVYDVVVFGLESVIFALIGLVTAGFVRDLPPSERTEALELVAAVTVTLLAVRALGLIAGATLPRMFSRRARRADAAASRGWGAAAVVTWAGARGVIPLAAALSVPLTVDAGGAFPHRSLLLVVATGAVVISLVVQGTTLEPLVRRAGLAGEQRTHAEQVRRARYATLSAALSALPQVAHGSVTPGGAADRLREDLEWQLDNLQAAMSSPEPAQDIEEYRRLRRRLLEVEGEELARLRAAGEVDAETYRTVLRHIDLEHARESAVADVTRSDHPLSG